MEFDFTTVMQRQGRDALAVDALGKPGYSGAPKEGFDAIPMWVADMNFPTAPSIVRAIVERAQHPRTATVQLRGDLRSAHRLRRLPARARLTGEEAVREGDSARCAVRKDSGDDPDVTNGMEVCAQVKLLHHDGEIVFIAGDGVGVVTEDGLKIPKGGAAINPETGAPGYSFPYSYPAMSITGQCQTPQMIPPRIRPFVFPKKLFSCGSIIPRQPTSSPTAKNIFTNGA